MAGSFKVIFISGDISIPAQLFQINKYICEVVMKVKYQVFISSTYEDMKMERDQLIKCILEMGHIPVGMEMFSAANEEQWKVIQRQIDDCDYYLVIVAHRYGSTDGCISYTEKEYNYALSKGIPVLGFVLDDSVSWKPEYMEDDVVKKEKLLFFKKRISSKMVSFWKSTEDLYGKAAIALNKAITTYERPGYVRATEAVDKEIYKELARLSSENSELRISLEQKEKELINSAENEEKELISIMQSIDKPIPIRFGSISEWNHDYRLTLLELFECIGKAIIDETDELNINHIIAFSASKRNDYNKSIPVPTNKLAEWLSDLFSLGLIYPSNKKHSVKDTGKYWSLTVKGEDLLKIIRKLKLYSGLPINNNGNEVEKAMVQGK